MLVREQGILLRAFKYSETSLVLHLFLRERGMISIMAKGVRRRGSRLASVLQKFAEIEVLFYYRDTRDLHQLRDATQLRQFSSIINDYDKFITASVMMELLDRVHPAGGSDSELYLQLLRLLELLDGSTRHYWNYLFYLFLYHFYRLGIAFHPEKCLYCGQAPTVMRSDVIAVDLSSGGVVCSDCSPRGEVIQVPVNVIRAAEYLLTVEPEAIDRRGITTTTGRELYRLLDLYLRQHVDYYRGLKSAELLFRPTQECETNTDLEVNGKSEEGTTDGEESDGNRAG